MEGRAPIFKKKKNARCSKAAERNEPKKADERAKLAAAVNADSRVNSIAVVLPKEAIQAFRGLHGAEVPGSHMWDEGEWHVVLRHSFQEGIDEVASLKEILPATWENVFAKIRVSRLLVNSNVLKVESVSLLFTPDRCTIGGCEGAVMVECTREGGMFIRTSSLCSMSDTECQKLVREGGEGAMKTPFVFEVLMTNAMDWQWCSSFMEKIIASHKQTQ